MALDRGIRGAEGPATNDHVDHMANESFSYHHIELHKCVFNTNATTDSGKSDEQLNHELNNSPSIYGPHDTNNGAVGDLQKGIKSDSRTRHDLGNAIERAAVGDADGAMQYLRKATGDLNSAGEKIDSGLSKLGDGGQSDGSRIIQRGMVNEADCSENIQKAEQLLRDGDMDGAIKAMTKGIREVAHRQHQTRDGIASIQGDDNNAIDWQNYGPMNSSNGPRIGGNDSDSRYDRGYSGGNNSNGSYDRGYNGGNNSDGSYDRGFSGGNNSNGSSDTSFYPEHNQGDQYFDGQQRVNRPTNGGWNSTQPFTPDNSGSYSPGGDYNGNYDYNGNNSPTRSTNFNPFDLSGLPSPADIANSIPNPFDLARDLGLPTPPSPSDLLHSLPNPLDMLGGGSNGGGGNGGGSPFDIFGGLPNPMDMIGGHGGSGGRSGGSPFDMFGGLPNPTDMFGGGGNGGGSGGGSPFDMFGGLPNPTDMFGGGHHHSGKGGGSPFDLLKPPKSPKDLLGKISHLFG